MAEPAKAEGTAANTNAPAGKDLYEMGEIPPLGHVPKNMYAWAIRKERHSEPETAMQVEVVPTWELDSHDVLVYVMAAGVNTTASGHRWEHRFQPLMAMTARTTSQVPMPPASSGPSGPRSTSGRLATKS